MKVNVYKGQAIDYVQNKLPVTADIFHSLTPMEMLPNTFIRTASPNQSKNFITSFGMRLTPSALIALTGIASNFPFQPS